MSKRQRAEFTAWLQDNQITLLRAAKVICFDTQNAEDVLQEALADIYSKWNRIKEFENLQSYAFRVMVSKHANMRRKWLRKKDNNETSFDLAENIRAIADHSDDVAQRLLVQAALRTLTASQRAVLVLIYEQGLTLKEVAKVLNIPFGTAASHLARGKAAVASYIDLIPEFERSLKKSIPNSRNMTSFDEIEEAEVISGEVVEE
mgnify:CR=1 FL=1